MAATPMAGLATSINPGSDLASLFECPVCFDYVLPPILQVWQAADKKNQSVLFSKRGGVVDPKVHTFILLGF